MISLDVGSRREDISCLALPSGSCELCQLRLLKQASSPDPACSLCVELESHLDVPCYRAREKTGNTAISGLLVGEVEAVLISDNYSYRSTTIKITG